MPQRVFFLWLALTIPSGAALAETIAPAATAAQTQEAKVHFAQGVALYNDGNFNAALAEFEQAYKLKKTAGVLYNIGLTQKALFRYSEAVDSLEHYLAEAANLAPERKTEVRQLITEMKALLADITLQIEPAGAAISVDGRSVGTAPLAKPLGLAPGNHVIESSLDGYRPARKELLVTAGVPITVKLKLDAVPKSGRVRITASQPKATISIDGAAKGAAPLELELPQGGHTVEVAASGYATNRREVMVAAGQFRTVEVNLEKSSTPIYKKWYFWVPLIAVVAGGTATGLVLGLTPQSPLDGTLNPKLGKVN